MWFKLYSVNLKSDTRRNDRLKKRNKIVYSQELQIEDKLIYPEKPVGKWL